MAKPKTSGLTFYLRRQTGKFGEAKAAAGLHAPTERKTHCENGVFQIPTNLERPANPRNLISDLHVR